MNSTVRSTSMRRSKNGLTNLFDPRDEAAVAERGRQFSPVDAKFPSITARRPVEIPLGERKWADTRIHRRFTRASSSVVT